MEEAPDFMVILIVSITVLLILFSIATNYLGIFQKSEDISGSGEDAAVIFAKKIMDCWSKHRYGLDPNSDVCETINIDLTSRITEKMVTEHIDCSTLPNNKCLPDYCGSCTNVAEKDKDKILWSISNTTAKVKIFYSGSKRKIQVEQIIEESEQPLPTSLFTTTSVPRI